MPLLDLLFSGLLGLAQPWPELEGPSAFSGAFRFSSLVSESFELVSDNDDKLMQDDKVNANADWTKHW